MRAISLAFVLACLSVGCGPTTSSTPAIKVGFVPMGTTDPYWQAVHAGASRAAVEMDVELVWPTAFRVGDVSAQIRAIEDMRRRGATAIAIAPIDPSALARPIGALVDAGVPTVIFDSPLDRDDLPFVGSDNYRAGEQAGEHMAKAIGGRGGVIVLRIDPGAASVDERVRGFLDAVARHPGMTIVSHTAIPPGIESAFVQSHEILKASGARQAGRVAGVFTPSQALTVGMVRALQNFRLTRQIRHVGHDTSPLLANLLQRRQLDALVVQDPDAMGRLSLVTLVRMLRNQPTELRVSTPVVVATPDTVEVPIVKALLRPNLTIVRR